MKNVKKRLFEHTFNIKKLENIRLEIERIETEYKGISGMSFDNEGGGGTNAISRKVENEALERLDRIEQLENEARVYEIKVKQVTNALDTLEDVERRIIEMRYFENIDPYTTAELAGFSYRQALRIHNKVLEKINMLLFT